MFLWKNAIVLVGLLGMASIAAYMLVRARWERPYTVRLFLAGMMVACLAVSAVPMLATQILFALLLLLCCDRRVPAVATYLFFLFWTPSAGSLLKVSGAYIAPLTPFLAFAGGLLFVYLIHPAQHLRRRWTLTDTTMLLFIVTYCVCMSLREPPTGIARVVVTFFIPYTITYMVLSRMRLGSPELVMRLLLFAAAAASLLCLFETIRHWPLYSGIIGVKNDGWTIDAPRIWLERGNIVRAYGPYAHPLTGGAMMGLATVTAWALWRVRGRSLALAALGVLTALGLAATLSRSGLVVVAIGIMTFQFLRRRYLLAFLIPAISLLALVALPILGGADAQFSTTYRLGLIAGVPKALSGHIWLGYREAVGLGLLDDFIQGQGIVDLVNVYLGMLVEGGIVSVGTFLLFLLSCYPQYFAIRRMQPDREQLIFAQLLISLQTALIVALALLSEWVAPMQVSFVVAAMLVALRAEVTIARRAATPKPVARVATLPEAEGGERLPSLR